ncbi:MAG: hypothetical protein K6T73_06210 [Candidatus Bathyarchaeota archaeon]|nr:hypothetical protein [Candidatus Bathyarchaeota archaeon]
MLYLLAKNCEWHGLDELRRRLKIRPTEEEVFLKAINFLAEFNFIDLDAAAGKCRISEDIRRLLKGERL